MLDLLSESEFTNSVAIFQAAACGRFVFTCEHASKRIPARYVGLGLGEQDLERHIAWDIGANELALELARRLNSPLVSAGYSRLLLDLNREEEAHDRFPTRSEDTVIPGNLGLSEAEKALRHQGLYVPFHRAVDELMSWRVAEGLETIALAIHSFTPVYRGVSRPWQVGVLWDRDSRLAEPLLAALRREPGLCVGDNQPYAPSDGIYHTMRLHADSRGLASVMLEIRQDLLGDEVGRHEYAERLTRILENLHI